MATALQAPQRPAAWIVGTHLVAHALIQSTSMAVAFIVPVLAIKQFGAGAWESLILTAAPTVFFSLSIFWNDIFKRITLGGYLWLYWAVACLPIGLCGLTTSYWSLVPLFLVGCAGGSAYYPASGELYKALYPEQLRGRLYSVIWGGSTLVTAGLSFGMGTWLEHDPGAYSSFLPGCAVLQAIGIGLFLWLSHASGHSATREMPEMPKFQLSKVFEPVKHMKEVLKADPTFARYEAAYMTYGVGWMIVYALLPLLVTEKLHLSYEQITQSKDVVYLLAVVVMIYPAGMLMDKVGAIRSTGLSFALLTLHPLGLMLVDGPTQLAFVSVLYGVAHAGANIGWMLGPVSLAPSPDKVPQYVAIHATLVGIRGKVFQLAGVGLLWATGSFYPPLAVAALAYAWSGWQMWRLNERVKGRGGATLHPEPPAPPDAESIPSPHAHSAVDNRGNPVSSARS